MSGVFQKLPRVVISYELQHRPAAGFGRIQRVQIFGPGGLAIAQRQAQKVSIRLQCPMEYMYTFNPWQDEPQPGERPFLGQTIGWLPVKANIRLVEFTHQNLRRFRGVRERTPVKFEGNAYTRRMCNRRTVPQVGNNCGSLCIIHRFGIFRPSPDPNTRRSERHGDLQIPFKEVIVISTSRSIIRAEPLNLHTGIRCHALDLSRQPKSPDWNMHVLTPCDPTQPSLH